MHPHWQPNPRPTRPVPTIRTIEVLPDVIAHDVSQVTQADVATGVGNSLLDGLIHWRRETERHLPRTRHGFIL